MMDVINVDGFQIYNTYGFIWIGRLLTFSSYLHQLHPLLRTKPYILDHFRSFLLLHAVFKRNKNDRNLRFVWKIVCDLPWDKQILLRLEQFVWSFAQRNAKYQNYFHCYQIFRLLCSDENIQSDLNSEWDIIYVLKGQFTPRYISIEAYLDSKNMKRKNPPNRFYHW